MKQFVVFCAIVALAACDAPQGYNYNSNNVGGGGGGGFGGNNAQQGGGGGAGGNAGGGNYAIPNANNDVPILRLENTNNGEGGYQYAYETGDGTSAQEQGYLKDADSPTAQGGFAFVAPDGQQFSIQYTADENGFQPQGAHIPTPPPIPEEILKALEQNQADEARGIVDDGQYRPEASPQQQYNNNQYNNQQGGGQYNNNNNNNQQQQGGQGYKY